MNGEIPTDRNGADLKSRPRSDPGPGNPVALSCHAPEPGARFSGLR
jgi:hypothetical protein